MMFSRFRGLLLGSLLIVSPASAAPAPGADAEAIHRRILTLDSHADVLEPSTSPRYLLPGSKSRVDLPHLMAGGVDAVVLAVAVGPGSRDAAGVADARKQADEKLATIKSFIAANPQRVGLALGAGDVERLHRNGKIAILIGFQNARSIGKDLSQIDVFYKEGVRVFAFNHAGHNDLSDSSRPQNEPAAEHGGLSPLGKEAVKKLNDLGVLIDVSQVSTDALLQTLQLSRAPVAATHSSARALVDHPRNLSDAELDAIKANGGVVQVTAFPAYVHKPDEALHRRIAEIRTHYGLSAEWKMVYDGMAVLPQDKREAMYDDLVEAHSHGTLSDIVDHIDYISKRIGWQHVGIGSDFDHGSGVTGFDSEADAPNVTRELVKRGYTEKQIAAIWGGNFLRVLRAAEAARTR